MLDKLRAFVEQRGGKLEPVQCEVTYVNHILLQDDDLALGPLGNVLKGVSTHVDRQLPIAESARLATSYLMRDPNTDQALGRLHVVAESARLSVDRRPAILLNITARGRPCGSSLEDTLAFCDMGRAWVVNGFKDLTTTPMHERWGLKEDHQ